MKVEARDWDMAYGDPWPPLSLVIRRQGGNGDATAGSWFARVLAVNDRHTAPTP